MDDETHSETSEKDSSSFGEETVRIEVAGLEQLRTSEPPVGAPIRLESLGVTDDDATLISSLTQKPPDKYRFRKSLGRGGMKMVIQVNDRDTMRDIAMAVLPDAANRPKGDIRRFIEEARITASLEHPNIVPVHDIGVDKSGSPYFTMKLLRGETLASIIRKLAADDREYAARYTLERRIRLFLKVCNAVAFAHSKGVLHLDLKPDNVQVGDFGEVLLMDWGLAKVVSGNSDEYEYGEGDSSGISPSVSSVPDATVDGITKGTPGYMAPEQAAGKNSLKDFRTDIYALGAILYTLATFRNPLSSRDNLKQMMSDTIHGRIQPPRMRAPELMIPGALEAVILKAMSVDPDQRYPSVKELRDELYAFLGGFATVAERAGVFKRSLLFIRRHRISFPAIAVSIFLLAGVTFYAFEESARLRGDWIKLYSADFSTEAFSPAGMSYYNSTIYSHVPAWEVSAEGLRMRAGEWLWLSDLKVTGSSRVTVKFLPLKGDSITVSMNSNADPLKYTWNQPSGYSAVFGGFGGTLDMLFKSDKSSSSEMLASGESGIIPGQVNTIVFEREEDKFKITVNEKTIIETSDLFPLPASNAGMLGIRAEGLSTVLKSVDVYRQAIPEKATPLLAGDVLLARRHYSEAAEQYLTIADNYSAGPITDEALAKAYFTAASFLEDKEERVRIMSDVKRRITPRLANFKYRGKILELDALTLWIDGNFRQALNIAEELFKMNPNTEIIPKILQLPHLPLPSDAADALLDGVRKTRGLTRLNISGYSIRSLEKLAGMRLAYLDCSGNSLESLSGLENMPLEVLDCSGNRIVSLEPLSGIPLKSLTCGGNLIESLAPLDVRRLKTLSVTNNRISSLDPLRGADLEQLAIRSNRIRSLVPLYGMSLKNLDAGNNLFNTLTPLCGMPLEVLFVDGSGISNLQPVRDMRISTLSLHGCANLADLSPIFSMDSLQMLSLPPNPENIEPLRNLPLLMFITDKGVTPQSVESETADAFWDRWDRAKKNLR